MTRTPLTGPSVWTGAEIKTSKRWIRDLAPAHVAELDQALKAVKHLDWSEIKRADFPKKVSAAWSTTSPTSWRTASAS